MKLDRMKLYCKNLEEFYSISSLFKIRKDYWKEDVIKSSFKTSEKLFFIFHPDSAALYCCATIRECGTCDLCDGFKNYNASDFLREEKLKRILK